MKQKIQKYRQIFLPLMLIGVVLGVYFNLNGGIPLPISAQAGTTVTFGTIGDMGGSSNASAVLNSVKSANLNFFLHVGDFSYDQQGGPSGWPAWVTSIVGTVLPYEIVSGNHDDCCIASYVQGLPNKMANLNGTYGQNYYFDYPQTSPLTRVIMISPGGFTVNTAWLTTAIDSARSSNIPWVIVAMHRNCITTGQKSCEIGTSLFDMLLSKKVDLIIQGHDHNYQRSKQLSCAVTNSVNQACIVNAGPAFTKGAGSIILIDGAGGNGFYPVSASDSEAGYFAKIDSSTYGYTKFVVTATQLTGDFVKAAGGSLTDSFTISGSGNPAPSTSPQPTAGVTGVPTPTNIVPTYVCIGGIPCTSPSPTSIVNPTTGGGTLTPIVPTNPATSTTPNPTITQPCSTNGVVSIQANQPKKHRKVSIAASRGGFLQQFIEFLMQLLQLLLQLIGLTPPGPTPTPTPTPGSPIPTGTQPSPTGSNPTINPCISPVITNSLTPADAPSPTQPVVTPSVFPTLTIGPSATPTAVLTQGGPTLTVGPSSIPTTTSTPAVTTSPVPSPTTNPSITQPCLASTSGVTSIQARHSHKHRKNNVHTGFLQQFIEFLMRFFEMLLQLIGITQPGPTPTPTPAVPTPTQGIPTPTGNQPSPTGSTPAVSVTVNPC